jgi:hypothetical protein
MLDLPSCATSDAAKVAQLGSDPMCGTIREIALPVVRDALLDMSAYLRFLSISKHIVWDAAKSSESPFCCVGLFALAACCL